MKPGRCLGVGVTIGFLVIFSISWACGWVILSRLIRAGVPASGADLPEREGIPPSWSLVIPARNEESRLPRLLASLADLRHPPVDLLVVDDGSTDRTAAVARSLGAEVLPSKPLPAGWRGKNWACHQGAAAARGEVLVFLDADTWLTSHKIPLVRPGQVLSLLPHHEVPTLIESASLFFNIAMAVGTIPDGLAGQSLVIHRDDYAACGGHRAVRDKILETFFLAERLRGHGCRVGCFPGRGQLSFRMYPDGWRGICEGWIKGFAGGASGTPPMRLMLVVFWIIGLVLPWVAFGWAAAPWLCLLAAGLAGLQVGLIARRLGSFPWLVAWCYPLPLLCFFGLFAISKAKQGRSVSWKGRSIHGA